MHDAYIEKFGGLKGNKPPLLHGYEIVNEKYETLIRNTATNAIVGPVVEHDNIVSIKAY